MPTGPRRDPARTALASVVAVLSLLIGLVLLAWGVLYVTKGRFLKHRFERLVSAYTHRDVRVAGDFNLYFDPIRLHFLAEGLSVSNPSWASKPQLFAARRIDTLVETIPLIFGRKHIALLDLADGAIDLEWDAAHKGNTWTFGDPNAKGEPFEMPLIKRAAVTGTSLRYRDPSLQLLADIRVDPIDAANNKVGNSIRFAGDGTMRRFPFTLTGQLASPNALIAGGENRFEAHVRANRTAVDLAATLPGATQIEGVDMTLGIRGQNVRDLFDLAGIAVPDTRAYRLRAILRKDGQDYGFRDIAGRYGASDIGGTLKVHVPTAGTDERLKLDARLASRRVDMVDIGPFVGFDPNALATKGATAAATTQGPKGATPRILPDAPLRVDAIKLFDAQVRYTIATIRQPFVPISNIVLGLDLDRSLLKLAPLDFDVAGGHLASTIGIDARRAPVFTDYDIRLSPTPLGKLLGRFGVADAGTTGTIKARIKMSGSGDTVRQSLATSNGRIAVVLPKGTFWTSYAQLAEFDIGVFAQKMFQKKLKEPVEVNCGLIAFTVQDGVAAADPVLIDTAKNVMTAKGGFSFRDESLDLRFRADGKKISLFSGQSPVGIRGHFAAPAFQIVTPQLLARAGVGAALGVAAGPAALLAFVDPGDAKAAACGPVLAGASAAAQRTVKGDARKDVGSKGENRKDAADGKGEKKRFLGIKL